MSDRRTTTTVTPNASLRPTKARDIHWDLGESLSYGQYLQLDKVLRAQRPLSKHHDEMLFIIMHQASELWMKLCIHELRAAIDHIRGDDLGPAFKMLARVSRVQIQLAQSWDVLSTMTPADYSAFRESLGKARVSSRYQYRMLEYIIGNKNPAMIEVHRRDARAVRAAAATRCTARASTTKACDCWHAADSRSRRSTSSATGATLRGEQQVAAAWLAVYRNVDDHWDLYELAEKLVDLDQRFQLWRFAT